MKPTEKYLAGLIDADGTIGVRFFRRAEGDFRPAMFLQVTQMEEKDRVLHFLHAEFGGRIQKSPPSRFGTSMSILDFSHSEAMKLAARIEKYLVIKRARTGLFLKYVNETKRVPADRLEVHRQQLKAMRKVKLYMPNFPTRAWMAGYIDGDGCIASNISAAGKGYMSLRVTSHEDDKVGILLLQKAFGGEIYYNKGPHLPMWVLHMPPSKAKEVLGYFAKHSIIKRAEVYFVLGCAEGGNYRDGDAIHSTLRQLKAQEQRLNDPDIDVSPMLKQIRFSIKDGRGMSPGSRGNRRKASKVSVSDSPTIL